MPYSAVLPLFKCHTLSCILNPSLVISSYACNALHLLEGGGILLDVHDDSPSTDTGAPAEEEDIPGTRVRNSQLEYLGKLGPGKSESFLVRAVCNYNFDECLSRFCVLAADSVGLRLRLKDPQLQELVLRIDSAPDREKVSTVPALFPTPDARCASTCC